MKHKLFAAFGGYPLSTFVFILLTGLIAFTTYADTENEEVDSLVVGRSLMFEPALVANSLHLTVANHGRSRGFGFVEMPDSGMDTAACELINLTVIRYPYNSPATSMNPMVIEPVGDGEVVAGGQLPKGYVAKFLISNGGGPKNLVLELQFSPPTVVSCELRVNATPVDEFGNPTGGGIPILGRYIMRPVIKADLTGFPEP